MTVVPVPADLLAADAVPAAPSIEELTSPVTAPPFVAGEPLARVVGLVAGPGAPLAGTAMVLLLIVVGVLAVAAVTKALTPGATTRQLSELGVPAAAVVALVLPLVELTVAVAAVAAPRLGALAAVALLAAFSLVLVPVVRSGRAVRCGCLGSLGREPVSARTLARNGLLAAAALPAIGLAGPVAPDLSSVVAATTLTVLALLGLQLAGLHHRIGRLWSVELAGELGRHSEPAPISSSHQPGGS